VSTAERLAREYHRSANASGGKQKVVAHCLTAAERDEAAPRQKKLRPVAGIAIADLPRESDSRRAGFGRVGLARLSQQRGRGW